MLGCELGCVFIAGFVFVAVADVSTAISFPNSLGWGLTPMHTASEHVLS